MKKYSKLTVVALAFVVAAAVAGFYFGARTNNISPDKKAHPHAIDLRVTKNGEEIASLYENLATGERYVRIPANIIRAGEKISGWEITDFAPKDQELVRSLQKLAATPIRLSR